MIRNVTLGTPPEDILVQVDHGSKLVTFTVYLPDGWNGFPKVVATEAQTQLGYDPAGYGGPFGLNVDSLRVARWSCQRSCD